MRIPDVYQCAAAIFLLTVHSGCHRGGEPEQDIRTVKVEAVGKSSAAVGERYSASVLPSARVDVSFRIGGYVDAVTQVVGPGGKMRNIQDGDPVAKGAVLARLRQSDVEQKLAEAKAARAEAKAAKEQAELDNKRTQALLESKTASPAEADAARIRLDVAVARVAAAEAKLTEAQTAVGDSSLKSPIDGIVIQRNVEVGTLAAPGAVAFQIADTRLVKVVFGVPDVILSRLSVGADQAVETEAFKNRSFVGKITRIAPFADQKSRVFEVEVSIPNDDGALRIGMVASLSLPSGLVTSSVMLPLESILRSAKNPDGFAVLVVDETQKPPVAHVREVKLGDFVGNQIPVLEGVKPEDRVIVRGASFVADGEKVRILADDANFGGTL